MRAGVHGKDQIRTPDRPVITARSLITARTARSPVTARTARSPITARPVRLAGPAAMAALLTGTLLSGCSTGGLFGSPTSSATTSGAARPTTRPLPDEVGKGLQYAVDALHAGGFDRFSTHDASGRMRAQVLYKDWKVCFQTPGAGVQPTSTRVDLAVVKLDESCPAGDQGLVTVTAGAVTPDLRGRSARYAADVLGSRASISFKTRAGGNAVVLVDSNWEVCDQTPAPGQPYGGVPVTLVVAKYSDGGCAKP